MYLYIDIYISVYIYTHTYLSIYLSIYLPMDIYSAREGGRDREGETKTEREGHGEGSATLASLCLPRRLELLATTEKPPELGD